MRHAITGSLALIGLLAPLALAQDGGLTAQDIEALRQQGEREGWTFTVGESEATQRPLEELCGIVIPKEIPPAPTPAGLVDYTYRGDLPIRFDWRDFGGLPSIKNQGQCGSCWAFGTMGPMECTVMLRKHIEYDFSEQWLVSCNQEGWGCGGGWVAHDYHVCNSTFVDPCNHSGAVYEADFPYVAKDDPCECPYEHPFCLHTWGYVNEGFYYPNVEEVKRAILTYGPVSGLVYVGSAFQAYKTGVFNACGTGELNHLITLVGWDDSLGERGCWILRNSWAPSWGMAGYMYIQYDCACVGYMTAWVEYLPEDCNNNNIPDVQEPQWADCNNNNLMDECEVGGTEDCNNNQAMDVCDLFNGVSQDCNGNLVPDECDIANQSSDDCNENLVPDECETGWDKDCNQNGKPDLCDIYDGISQDCNQNAIPDECEPEWNLDCNNNGVKDICDIYSGTSQDADANWVPDECQRVLHVPAEHGTIQAAIDAANLGDTVLVADGVYTGSGNTNLRFNGKRILVLRSENGPENCIIDGQHTGYGFMIRDGEGAAAVIQGFTVRHADIGLFSYRASPTVRQCRFIDNDDQGALLGKDCNGLIENCLFAGNGKGGVGVSGSKPHVENCTIVGNRSPNIGGGIGVSAYGGPPHPRFRNCLVWDNRAVDGGPQIALGDTTVLAIEYSNIQGGEDDVMLGFNASLAWGGGMLDEDPMLKVPGHWDDNGTPGELADDFWVHGDCRLIEDSPCVNAGDPVRDYSAKCDLMGRPRLIDGRVDMGTYEYALMGDLNCDAVVDFDDINGFIRAMVGPAYYAAGYPDCHHFRADISDDGHVDFDDINPFVQLLFP